MRDLNECQAEVFRRSETRIKERRKARNRILALCIPLCLIVTVWSVMILPTMLPARESSDNAAEGIVEENVGSIVCSYTEVEIQNVSKFPEHYEKLTDKIAVTKIFSSIHSLFVGVDGADHAGGGLPDADGDDNQTGNTSNPTGYMITFSTEDGSQTVYNLNDNTLLNMMTNETVILTDTQVAELKAALGISE